MTSYPSNLWVLLGLGLAGIFIWTRKLKRTVRDDFGAFMEKFQLLPPPPPAPPKAPHPLSGLTFAISDLFDIEGYVTGFGHPDWARTHGTSYRTSPVVSGLVNEGATCIGKTVVGELVYSINGENSHYGTPTNLSAPGHVPGGSSSGSAVAVAAGLTDFSLGVDAVGDVRVPAAFCGVIGFRPSFGAISHKGILPISTSLDTVGCFAKDPSVVRRVGHVLLQLPFGVPRNPRQVIIADDYFELLRIPVERVVQVLVRSTEKLFGRNVLRHELLGKLFLSEVPSLEHYQSIKLNGKLGSSPIKLLANILRKFHRYEFKCNHAEWIKTEKPILNAATSKEMNDTPTMSDAEVETFDAVKNEMRMAITSLLKDDGILVLPTTAYCAPKLKSKEKFSEDYIISTLAMSSVASLSGCCQVTIPLGHHDHCPIAVSLIARHGGDRFLLDALQVMHAPLQEEVDVLENSNSSNSTHNQTKAEIAKEKGNQAFKDKKWQKAMDCYTEAIKFNSKNATYYSNRAAAYLKLGSFIQADDDCTKAINLDKKNVKAYFRRGTAKEMLGYYEEAMRDYHTTLVLEPTNAQASTSAKRLEKLFR